MKISEGELIFDFSGCIKWQRLDEQEVPIPIGMSLVDFVVEEHERILLIEVKDPSHSQAGEKEQKKFIKQLSGDGLVTEHLVPKCRDSYTYLHLMEEDRKPFLYIVLISIEEDGPELSLLLALKERLLKRLRHEAKEPWKRQYVKDCLVLNISMWHNYLPYTVTRSPDNMQ